MYSKEITMLEADLAIVYLRYKNTECTIKFSTW